MCHVLANAVDQAVSSVPSADRRHLLKMLGIGAAGATAATVLPASKASAATVARGNVNTRTKLTLLGTAGGPVHLGDRFGISTAISFGERVYVVDLGLGSFQRLAAAGLAPETGLGSSLSWLRGVFFTHLHSDHTVDWPGMYATGTLNEVGRTDTDPIKVFGPGPRDTLTRVFPPTRPTPPVVNPADPAPGITGMTGYLRQAFAQDFNDRLRDTAFTDPGRAFEPHDIPHAGLWSIDPEGIPPRLQQPIEVWEDGDVRITATFVDHRPTAPAYGYRFDTPDGSVVVSGDTCVSANLIDLARGADYLVHEVIDPQFVDRLVATLPPGTAEAVREHLLASHTTIEQVGRDVAEPAGVKNLVLSHLVPGNNPISRWKQAQRGYSGRLIVGDDLMTLPVGKARA